MKRQINFRRTVTIFFSFFFFFFFFFLSFFFLSFFSFLFSLDELLPPWGLPRTSRAPLESGPVAVEKKEIVTFFARNNYV